MSKQESKALSMGRWLAVAGLLGVGYLAGVSSRDATVQADGRDKTEQQPFRSGAQRSELLLGEISATLGKMDTRLDRMEKLATQFVNRNKQPVSRETRLR